jgi:hypothetical protein
VFGNGKTALKVNLEILAVATNQAVRVSSPALDGRASAPARRIS